MNLYLFRNLDFSVLLIIMAIDAYEAVKFANRHLIDHSIIGFEFEISDCRGISGYVSQGVKVSIIDTYEIDFYK